MLARLRLFYAMLLWAGSSGPLLSGRSDRGMRRFVRILSVRHAIEGLVAGEAPSRPVLAAAAGGVDAVHALTMLVLAVRPTHRPAALANALVAAAFSAAGLARLRSRGGGDR